MKAIDLFAGCGGLSLGLSLAGIQILEAYEFWEPAVNVYRRNFTHPVLNLDLSNLSDYQIEHIKKLRPDIIAGGPPCQDFSSAGARNENAGRADLTITFAELISKIKPLYFIMENVNLISKSTILDKAKSVFKKENYGLSEVILDASFYGVPQNRKRYFLVGELGGEDSAIEKYLLSGKSDKRMTIKDYLGNSLGVDFYYRHPRSYSRRAIFSIDEPSPTVRGVNRPIPSNYKFHEGDRTHNIEKVRPLTTIERSYIQTFPKEFIFQGTKTDLEQMIGNAVPVNLAKHIGHSLIMYQNDKFNEND